MCQWRRHLTMIYFASMSRNDAQISRNSVTTFDFHKISNHNFFSIDILLLTITDNQGLLCDKVEIHLTSLKKIKKILIIWKDYCQYLRDKVLERVHDFGALGLLIVWETSSDHHNSREHNTQIQLHRTTEETLGILLEQQRDLKRHTLKKHKQGFLLTLSLAGSSSEAAWMP